MDEQVIDDLYARAQSKGYKKGRLDFIQLIQSDEDVFNDMYQYVQAKGYKKDSQDFSSLIGKTEAPAVKKKDTASVSEPGSLVSPEPEVAVEPAIAPAPPTPEIQDITGAPDPDFFEERMAMVSPELIDRGDEDEVAQELTKVFKPYGFDVEPTSIGDAIKVTAANGQTIDVDLDPLEMPLFMRAALGLPISVDFNTKTETAEAKKLQDFLRENRQEGLDAPRMFVTREQREAEVKKINKRHKEVNRLSQDYFKSERDFADKYPQFQTYDPEYIKNNPEEYQMFLADRNILEGEREFLGQMHQNTKDQGAQLDRLAGEYTEMLAERGYWSGGVFINEFIQGAADIAAGAKDFGLDTGYNPEFLMDTDPEFFRDNYLKEAAAKGYDVPSASDMTVDEFKAWMKTDKGIPAKESIAIQNGIVDTKLKRRKRGEPIDYKEAVNAYSQYATSKNMEVTGGELAALRRGLDFLKDPESTPEAADLMYESFWGGALLGVTRSLPAMLAPGGFIPRTAAMYSQIASALEKEMAGDPEFQNISESEKFKLKLAIGSVSAALESVGFSYLLAKKSITTGLLMKLLKKSPKNITGKSFNDLVMREVDSAVGRGLLTLGSGGAIEFETGFLQEGVDIGFKSIYNEMKEKEMFETPEGSRDIFGQMLYAGAQEAVGGLVLGTPGAVSAARGTYDFTAIDNLTFEMFQNVSNLTAEGELTYRDMFYTNQQARINRGEISKADAQQEMDNLDEVIAVNRDIPSDLTIDQQKRSLGILLRRKDLQEQIEGKDPILVKRQLEELDGLNGELEEILYGTQDDAIQEQGPESVDAPESTRDSEAVGEGVPDIGEPTTEVEAQDDVTDEATATTAEVAVEESNAFKSSTGDSDIDGRITRTVMMSPDEYLKQSWEATDGKLGGTYESWLASNKGTKETIESYAKAIREGDKFPLPYIDKARGSQDGRNRALAAKEAGLEEIPVGIIEGLTVAEEIKELKNDLKTTTSKAGVLRIKRKIKSLETSAKKAATKKTVSEPTQEVTEEEQVDIDEFFGEQEIEGVERVSENLVVNRRQMTSDTRSRAKEQRTINRVKQLAIKAAVSLSKQFPDVRIVLHETPNQYKRFAGELARGSYDYKTKTIHINLTNANTRTVAHEVFHALILEKALDDPNAVILSRKMLESVKKTIDPNSEFAQKIDKFVDSYADRPIVQDEEYLAELTGMLAAQYKTLNKPAQNAIKEFFRKLAKLIGIDKKFGLDKYFGPDFLKTDAEVIDLLNTISRKIRQGVFIESSDLAVMEKIKKKSTPEELKKAREDVEVALDEQERSKREKAESGTGNRRKETAVTPRQQVEGINPKDVRMRSRSGNRVGKGLSVKKVNNEAVVEEIPDLTLDYVRENAPASYLKNANLIAKYPLVRGVKNFDDVSTLEQADEVYEVYARQVADNLNWIMESYPEEYREISTLWYDGANKIANELAADYGVSPEQVAGIIASLSPQNDWYQNVRAAELSLLAFRENPVMSQKMIDYQVNYAEGKINDLKKRIKSARKAKGKSQAKAKVEKFKAAEVKNLKAIADAEALLDLLRSYKGKRMEDAPDALKPYYVRLYNEVNQPKSYPIISPDGNYGSDALTDAGGKRKFGWGSYTEIGKGVSIRLDGSQENISVTLGQMHKIRNFFNNIIDPMSKEKDITMDTHAIAAALLIPASSKTKEVVQNFGTGTANSGVKGQKGLYYANQAGYFLSAEENNMLPRQVQSVTWEAVRGLFTSKFKDGAKNVKSINDIWENYAEGNITIEQARQEVLEKADGINAPSWAGLISDESRDGDGTTTERGRGKRGGPATEREGVAPRQQVAPNGRPSNLNEEQYKIVRTTAFKNWFGDWENDPENASKVVDENGEPMVMYHGTSLSAKADIEINGFDSSKGRKGLRGFSFMSNKGLTKAYDKGAVLDVFLKLDNPMDFKKNFEIRDEIIERVAGKGIKEMTVPDWLKYTGEISREFEREAIKLGYDGVFDPNQPESKVFKNTNIKYADGSNKTFDPDSPSIRMQVADIDNKIDVLKAKQTKASEAEYKRDKAGKPAYSKAFFAEDDKFRKEIERLELLKLGLAPAYEQRVKISEELDELNKPFEREVGNKYYPRLGTVSKGEMTGEDSNLGGIYEAEVDGYLFRGVSVEDYNRIKKEGFIDTDLRGAISDKEGINLTPYSATAFNYLPEGVEGVVMAMKVSDKSGLFMIGADDYVRSSKPIPFTDVEFVTTPVIEGRYLSVKDGKSTPIAIKKVSHPSKKTEPDVAPRQQLVYHVTIRGNKGNIQKKGLEKDRPAMWAKGIKRADSFDTSGKSFAFSNLEDAIKWGIKTKIEKDKEVSIVAINAEGKTLQEDKAVTEDPFNPFSSAVFTEDVISPSDILSVEDVDYKMGEPFDKSGEPLTEESFDIKDDVAPRQQKPYPSGPEEAVKMGYLVHASDKSRDSFDKKFIKGRNRTELGALGFYFTANAQKAMDYGGEYTYIDPADMNLLNLDEVKGNKLQGFLSDLEKNLGKLSSYRIQLIAAQDEVRSIPEYNEIDAELKKVDAQIKAQSPFGTSANSQYRVIEALKKAKSETLMDAYKVAENAIERDGRKSNADAAFSDLLFNAGYDGIYEGPGLYKVAIFDIDGLNDAIVRDDVAPRQQLSDIATPLPRQQKSVREVVQQARDNNFKDAATKDFLKRKGVPTADIDKAIKTLDDVYARVMKEIAGVIAKSQKRGVPFNQQLDNALAYLQGTKLYEDTTDIHREKLIREVRAKFDKKEKRAPSAKRILGNIKDVKKVTLSEKEALKMQLRLVAKTAKTTARALVVAGNELTKSLKEMVNGGVITANQMSSVLRRFSRVDLFNPASIDSFLDYMSKIFADAEYGAKIARIKKLLPRAKKNINSKIGVADVLGDTLTKLFNVNPTLIPMEMLEDYIKLVEMMGASKNVLPLADINDVTEVANKVLNAVYEEISMAEDLAEVFANYENKVIKDGKLDYAATIDAMIADQTISLEEAAVMRKYKSRIVESTTKEPKTEAEIAEERAELMSAVEAAKVNVSRLVMEEERTLARQLAKLMRTEAIERLSNQQLETLLAVIDNINNGFVTHAAQRLAETMNASNRAESLSESVAKAKPLSVSTFIGKIKAGITKNNKFFESVKRNPLAYLDQVFGDFKTTRIYDAIFKPLAQAYDTFSLEMKRVDQRLTDAQNAVMKSFKNDPNKARMSSYKMMAYMLQREFEANPDNKQVNPAADFIRATIDHINKGQSFFKGKDAEMLQQILDDFGGEQIDSQKLYDSFNKAERNALAVMEDINKSMGSKAVFTGAVIRGRRVDALNQYAHHNVLSTSGQMDRSADVSIIEAYNQSMRASTKAKNLIERTGVATPLNFDVFSSVSRGSRFTLTDFYLTEPIRTSRKTISDTRKLLEERGDVTKQENEIVNSIENALELALDDLLTRTFSQSTMLENVVQYVKKTGYRLVLASATRAGAEYLSNVNFAVIYAPKDFAAGMANKKMVMGTVGIDVMSNLKSTQLSRMYPNEILSGRMIDTSVLGEKAGDKGGRAYGDVRNKITQIYNGLLSPAKKGIELVADTLISAPDKAIIRPLWFGSFENAFVEITGKKPDFEKISANDEAYMEANQEALDKATDTADQVTTLAGAADNPFKSMLRGKYPSKAKQTALLQFFNNFNSFMTRFLIYEYISARTAVNAMLGNGMISKRQGAALLGAVVTRMVTYTLLNTVFALLLKQAFGLGDEEDEKDIEKQFGQALASTAVSLIVGRDFGNVVKGLLNYGVENLNEEFLDELRDGDYDPYRDSIAYTFVPADKEYKSNTLADYIRNLAGSFGPFYKMAEFGVKALSADEKKDPAARVRQLRELNERLPLEVLGNLGLIPFYREIRMILLADIYKDMGKEKKGGKTGMTKAEKAQMKEYFPEIYEMQMQMEEDMKNPELERFEKEMKLLEKQIEESLKQR